MESRLSRVSTAIEPAMPIVRALETDDFDRMAQAFVNWDHRFEQLSRGRFQGRLQFADFDSVQLFDCEVNQVILCRGGRLPDSFTFSPIQPSNAGSLWRGRLLSPGMINVVGPRQETDHRTNRDYRHTSITVRQDLLERVACGLIGVGLERLLGPKVPVIDQGLADSLVDRWRSGLRCIDGSKERRPGCGNSPINSLGFVADLVRSLAAGRIGDPVRMTPTQRAKVVHEAEQFARENPPESVTILTLCELTGVSERSLHYAFLEVTGLSPKAYIKSIRLNMARREIQEAGYDRGLINAVACKYGFHRPGNFAADYRRHFGELPSGSRNQCRPAYANNR